MEQWCLMNDLKALSYNVYLRTGSKSACKETSIQLVNQCTRYRQTGHVSYYSQAPPPMCLPPAYQTSGGVGQAPSARDKIDIP